MKIKFTTILVTACLILSCGVVLGQYNMTFRYYQLYKDDNDFDTTVLWNQAKLKKTFDNRGAFYYNSHKKSIKVKLRDTDYEETRFIFTETKNYLFYVNGWRYFKFTDPDLGPSIAIYQWPKRIWVIYRQNSPPKNKPVTSNPIANKN